MRDDRAEAPAILQGRALRGAASYILITPVVSPIIVAAFAVYKLARGAEGDYAILLPLAVITIIAVTLYGFGALMGWQRTRPTWRRYVLNIFPRAILYTFVGYTAIWRGAYRLVVEEWSPIVVASSLAFIVVGAFAALGDLRARRAARLADSGERRWVSEDGSRRI